MVANNAEPIGTGSLSSVLSKIGPLSEELKKAGLTDYEAKCYLAAIAIDGGRAEEIAELAQVPRTSAYKALESLIARGFISQSESRPKRFDPLDPVTIKGRLTGDIESTFDRIIDLQEELAHRGIPQVIYTMNGKERVIRKMGEMLERARDRFIISSPNISTIRKHHLKLFEKAIEKGVDVLVIAPPFVKLPICTQAVRRRSLIATDIVADGEEALIASSDLTACGFTDNVLLAGHLEGFLEIVMSQEWIEDSDS
ncbi:MAG: TrmB family transcriptional regulator [Thermoplasmata archaeon]|nr:TrmB family transcriptional regulator [Thermoplasmata archaeon]